MLAGRRAARGAWALIAAVLAGAAAALPVPSAEAAAGLPALTAVAGSGRLTAATALGGKLSGLAAVSARNVWAVGSSSGKTLIVHWNGRSWHRVTSPAPKGSGLSAIADVSSTDAWAVGYRSSGGSDSSRTLVLHWNGASWKQVTSPGPKGSVLFAVAAVSARDAWAVGTSYRDGSIKARTLVLHWNGVSWKQVTSPGPNGSVLYAAAAVSARDAWAVGTSYRDGSTKARTLVLHWNGVSWKQVRGVGSGLSAIAVVSARSAWAVGSIGDNTLVLHWNGTAWKRVSSPGPRLGGHATDGPHGVAAASARSAWVVGNSYASPATFKAVVLHWNGASWRKVGIPSSDGSVLFGVTAISATDAWAVGESGVTSTGSTLILHWNGAAWTREEVGTGTTTTGYTLPPTKQSNGLPDQWYWDINPSQPGLSGLPAVRAAYPAPGSANIWDTDLFQDSNVANAGIPTGPSPVVEAIHAAGHYAVCYVEAGAYQIGFPDDSNFAPADYGATGSSTDPVFNEQYQMQGYSNEYWFDLAGFADYAAGEPSTLTGVAPNIAAALNQRFAECKLEGQDAVEPDDLDGYTNQSATGAPGGGWNMTQADSAGFERWLAYDIHANGLAAFQKNDPANAAADAPLFDGMIIEECNYYHDPCSGPGGDATPYLDLGKPVLNAEYTQDGETTAQFCPADIAARITGALFDVTLDGGTYEPCQD